MRAPKLRQDLVAALSGAEPGPQGTSPQLERLRWLDDGKVDLDLLADDHALIGTLLSEAGLLAYGPISEWPAREQDRPGLAQAVVDRVFLGEGRGWMTEVELNARLAMVFFDPSGLRRLAVDLGMLGREADGSRYWLARHAGSAPVLD
ncbi:DUF2087 domain-containing protein [Isoptericola hypogeus]